MVATTNITLVSLAMLKVNMDEQAGDYLNYFQPFVLQALRKHSDSPISDQLISQSILELYGLRIPARTIQLILKRLSRGKFLKKKDGVFLLERVIPAENKEEQNRDKANIKIGQLIEKFCSYSSNIGQDFTGEHAVRLITVFLNDFSVECLKAYLLGTALPDLPEANGHNFLVAKFVQHIAKDDKNILDDFIVLVKGHMLANALLCPDLDSISRKFDRLTLFYDTPFLLQLLGLEGTAKREAAVEMHKLVQRLKGKTKTFEHLLQEVDSVLRYCENHIDRGNGANPVIHELRSRGMRPSDVALLRSKVDDELRRLGIACAPVPEYLTDFQIGELELQEAIESEAKYRSERALQYDINSIRSVYALRKGKAPLRLEDAVAVLVTTNSALAQAAYRYGADYESSCEVSTVITDFSLANIAWLKAPLSAPDLPEKELLAYCYDELSPPDGFWKKYVQEIERLEGLGSITADDHALLRSSTSARDELMNLTLGEEASLNEKSVVQILANLREELTKEKGQELDQEKQAHQVTLHELSALRSRESQRRRAIMKWSGRLASSIVVTGAIALTAASILVTLIFEQILSKLMSSYSSYALLVVLFVWSIIIVCGKARIERKMGCEIRDLQHFLEQRLTAAISERASTIGL